MATTTHTRSDGIRIVNEGERLYDVTIFVSDGQTATERVAADDEWKARTRAMAVNGTLRLGGQDVTYDVVEVEGGGVPSAQPALGDVEKAAGEKARFLVYYTRGGRQYWDAMFSPTAEQARDDFNAAAAELGWQVQIDRIEARA